MAATAAAIKNRKFPRDDDPEGGVAAGGVPAAWLAGALSRFWSVPSGIEWMFLYLESKAQRGDVSSP